MSFHYAPLMNCEQSANGTMRRVMQMEAHEVLSCGWELGSGKIALRAANESCRSYTVTETIRKRAHKFEPWSSVGT